METILFDDLVNDLILAFKYVNDQGYKVNGNQVLCCQKKEVSPLVALYIYNVKYRFLKPPLPSIFNSFGLFRSPMFEMHHIFQKENKHNEWNGNEDFIWDFMNKKYCIHLNYREMNRFDVKLSLYLKNFDILRCGMAVDDENKEIDQYCRLIRNRIVEICSHTK